MVIDPLAGWRKDSTGLPAVSRFAVEQVDDEGIITSHHDVEDRVRLANRALLSIPTNECKPANRVADCEPASIPTEGHCRNAPIRFALDVGVRLSFLPPHRDVSLAV